MTRKRDVGFHYLCNDWASSAGFYMMVSLSGASAGVANAARVGCEGFLSRESACENESGRKLKLRRAESV